MKIDVIYIGNSDHVAEYIFFNKSFNLKGIICEDKRIHDGLLTFSLVREIPIFAVRSKDELVHVLNSNGSDVLYISCSFCMRIPMELLRDYSVFNIHLAELPYYKGRHADYWAVMNDEKFVGVSLHIITEKFDDGDIIALEKVPYYFWEKNEDILQKLIERIPSLLEKLVEHLQSGIIKMKNTEGGYYRAITNEDKMIDITKDSPKTIFNKVRTQSNFRGAGIQIGQDFFYLKNVMFTKHTLQSPFMITGNILYIKYNEEICLKSDNFYYGYI